MQKNQEAGRGAPCQGSVGDVVNPALAEMKQVGDANDLDLLSLRGSDLKNDKNKDKKKNKKNKNKKIKTNNK